MISPTSATREPEQTTGDLPPTTHMVQLLVGFQLAQALYVAAKLDIATQLDDGPDYESMAASVRAGDLLLEKTIRAVDTAAQNEVEDPYGESAAVFLPAHLVTRHSSHRARPIQPVREDARVLKMITLMQERLAEPLTLADIAREVYLSVFHLVRVFKEATGVTPHRYLTRLRIEEAQRLLRNTDLPIADIAPRCGFASPGALSTAFLRHTGVRPSAYRNS